MTARYCWASGSKRGGGDIFDNVIKVASNQHIQFSVLFFVAHDSNSQDSVSRKSSDNKLPVDYLLDCRAL